MPKWEPGRSANPHGKPKGVPHKVTKEVRTMCLRLFDQDYWERKYRELHNGTCHPKIEGTLLAYAYGMPAKELHTSGTIVHLGALEALQAQIDAQATLDPPLTLDALPAPTESEH